MPDGVAVTVADGMALVEFLDPALRGPGVAALIAVGGASTVQKRTVPRPGYVVPEGNARAAGLLDDPAPVPPPVAAPEPEPEPVAVEPVAVEPVKVPAKRPPRKPRPPAPAAE